jgi:hypothetical protein
VVIILFNSGLKAAQDVASVKAAGITHLINLTRNASNCAEVATCSMSSESGGGLHSIRVVVFGLRNEPYRDLFRQITVHPQLCLACSFHLVVALR